MLLVRSQPAAVLGAVLLLAVTTSLAFADEPDWVAAMQQAHKGFNGQAGYVAQFGDSITYSMAFWSPMAWT